MQQRSSNLALIFTGVFLLLVALLVSGVLPSPVLIAAVACSGEYAPPNVAYDDCKRTQTAEAGGGGGGGGGNQQPTITSTSAVTRTATATLSASPATPTQAATAAPAPPTRAPTSAAAAADTPTATPALPSGVDNLVCIPGGNVTLVGEAPPGTALLAFFNDRPVGGGFSRADGSYSIELRIGNERPGQYLVEVRERSSRALIDQVGCEVPGATATPTLVAP